MATFLALSSSYYGATALTANVDNVGPTIGGSSSTSTTTTDSNDNGASSTSNRRGGIRSSPEPQAQAQAQTQAYHYHVPLGSDKPKLRSKKKKNKKNNTSGSGNNPIQTFAVNMLQSQGCPVSTSSCGDICYVLTPAAASDLHSVARFPSRMMMINLSIVG